MSTLNKALIAALVVQVALALLVQTRSRSGDVIKRPEPLLQEFSPDAVKRLAVYDAHSNADEPDEDGDLNTPSLTFIRSGSGDDAAWSIASHWDFPAKTEPVDEFLGKLAGLQTTGTTVNSAVRHGQLEVTADSYRRRIDIETDDGQVKTLYVGKPSRARTVFIRFSDEDGVHAVSGISQSSINPDVQSWVDSNYFAVNADDVAAMTVATRSGRYEFVRDFERRGWRLYDNGTLYPIPLDKKLNVVAVNNWLRSATRLISSQPADPKRKLDQPLATITLRMKPETPTDSSADDSNTGNDAATLGTENSAGSGGDAGVNGTVASENVATSADDSAVTDGNTDIATTDAAVVASSGTEYVIEVGAADTPNNYYVRMRDNPNAVIVAASRIRPVVDMNDKSVLIPAE